MRHNLGHSIPQGFQTKEEHIFQPQADNVYQLFFEFRVHPRFLEGY